MGGRQSLPTEDLVEVYTRMYATADSLGAYDIAIDSSLVMYSGLNSADVLKDYSSQVLSDLASKGPSFVASLGSSIAAFNNVPNAVGIGALVISIALGIAFSSSNVQKYDSPLNMVRRVFAEEKASGVRDSMDEYLKRLTKHLRDPTRALEDTKRLEAELSKQLTSLRNSMLKDDQMDIRSMKYWTNGAAFHTQMLIHEARLQMAGYEPSHNNNQHEKRLADIVDSVTSTVEQYQNDLRDLLKNLFQASTWPFSVDHADTIFMGVNQPKQLIEYFVKLKKNIRQLIMQRQAFNMRALKTK